MNICLFSMAAKPQSINSAICLFQLVVNLDDLFHIKRFISMENWPKHNNETTNMFLNFFRLVCLSICLSVCHNFLFITTAHHLDTHGMYTTHNRIYLSSVNIRTGITEFSSHFCHLFIHLRLYNAQRMYVNLSWVHNAQHT